MQTKFASHDDRNSIGQRLRMEMKKRGVSSVELAARADVKTSFLYDVISGKSANPSSVKLARVAESLGVSLAYLAGTSDIPTEGYQFALPGAEDNKVILPRLLVESSPEKGAVVAEKTRRDEILQFKKEWLKLSLSGDESNLRLFTVQGDGMTPTLLDGDVVIINTTQKSPSPPGLFLLFDGMALIVKRLERFTNGNTPIIKVTADNPHYSPYEIFGENSNIVGRVVWFSRAL